MDGIHKIEVSNYSKYINYGKLRGLIRSKKMGLSYVDDIFVMDGLIDISDYSLIEIFGDYPIFVRTDAPIGEGNCLPRGRNVLLKDINDFYLFVKSKCEKAILILSKHPSLCVAGKYISRYNSDGGVMIVFEKEQFIKIEYVGRGFDVGDITRGKTVHSSICIPYEMIFEKTSYIYYNCRYLGLMYKISQSDYEDSIMNRIEELKNNLGERNLEEHIITIPKKAQFMTKSIFEQIYNQCISKIVFSPYTIEEDVFGILINLYDGKACVIEVWSPSRSR